MKSILPFWLVVLLIAVLLAMTGCTPSETKRQVESPPDRISEVLPVNLRVVPGDQGMTVEWQRKGDGLISGYNIYISETPGAGDSSRPFNFDPYPGDTDPDDGVEKYQAEGLENGKKYYVSVRVIRPDRSLTAPTKQVMTVCGPHGNFRLQTRYSGEQDGFNLLTGSVVRSNGKENDLYCYFNDGQLFLASPDRLDGYIRTSRFVLLPMKGTLEEVREAVMHSNAKPTLERLSVGTGDWVMVKTADGYLGLLHIVGVDGTGKSQILRIDYILCPVVGERIF